MREDYTHTPTHTRTHTHTHTHTLIYIRKVHAYIDTFIHTYDNRKSNILENEQCGRTMVTILHGMAIKHYGTPAVKYCILQSCSKS